MGVGIATVTLQIVRLGSSERDEAAAVLTEAFVDEPWLRWSFQASSGTHVEMLAALQGFSVDIRLAQDWPLFGARIDGRLVGVLGTSLPSGGWPENLDRDWSELTERFGPTATARLDRVADLEHSNRPSTPVYEIGVVGVAPDARRRGIGRALIEAAEQDAWQRPRMTGLYLATADPANVPFYRRVGFEVLVEAEVAPGIGFWALQRPFGSATTAT